VIRALAHSGNCALGAFEHDRIVGFAVAFLGRSGEELYLHSHIVGVERSHRHRSVGYALKLEQRAWARRRGIQMLRWTTDPLVRRNAYFNLMKLGARVESYQRNFYGALSDAMNNGDESDRLLLAWHVNDGVPGPEMRVGAAELRGCGATVALDEDETGEPRIDEGVTGDRVLALVPDDAVAMRRTDPGRAGRWRHALRLVLTRQLAAGSTIAGITTDGYYVLEAERSDQVTRRAG